MPILNLLKNQFSKHITQYKFLEINKPGLHVVKQLTILERGEGGFLLIFGNGLKANVELPSSSELFCDPSDVAEGTGPQP